MTFFSIFYTCGSHGSQCGQLSTFLFRRHTSHLKKLNVPTHRDRSGPPSACQRLKAWVSRCRQRTARKSYSRLAAFCHRGPTWEPGGGETVATRAGADLVVTEPRAAVSRTFLPSASPEQRRKHTRAEQAAMPVVQNLRSQSPAAVGHPDSTPGLADIQNQENLEAGTALPFPSPNQKQLGWPLSRADLPSARAIPLGKSPAKSPGTTLFAFLVLPRLTILHLS